jgi:hypothetical protein
LNINYRRLIRRKATALVVIGDHISPRLAVDQRLQPASAVLSEAQDRLRAKVNLWAASVTAAIMAEADRDEAQRATACQVREFGFITLSASGNHHDEDPYRLYFPDGFGEAIRRRAVEMAEFCRVAVEKLAEETDPKILAYREQLAAARGTLLSTEGAYVAALNTRHEAFERMQAEKRNWVRGLSHARALADGLCFSERAYVRAIFAPADARRAGPGKPPVEDDAALPYRLEPAVVGSQDVAA